MKSKANAILLAGSFVGWGVLTQPLLAEENTRKIKQNQADEVFLEEILVTAQRREQTLFEVPLSLQAFSGQQLEDTGIRDITDMINFIPGASQGRSNTGATSTYQIRGVSSYYGESTIGYYLDEAVFSIPNRNYAPLARTFDVDRVEVLRGPQGTLYGQGAMGGTIRFITADPNLQEFQIRGVAGGSDTSDGDSNAYGDLAVSLPLIKDVLGVRLTGSYEEKGGFAESPNFPGDKDEDRIQNYRAKILARPAEYLTLKLMYQRNEFKDDWGKNYVSDSNPSFLAAPEQGRSNAVYDMYTGYLSYDFGSLVLESSTGYIERDDKGLTFFGLGPIGIGTLNVSGDSEIFSQEFRLVTQDDKPLQWVLGVSYQDAESEEIPVLFAPSPLPFGPPTVTIRDDTSLYETTSFAVFGEISYELMDGRLIPLFGLRYFEDDRDFHNEDRRQPPFGPPVPPKTSATSETFDTLNPRFNLSFTPTENQHYYINIAKGFRSGTFNTSSGVDAAAAEGLIIDTAVDEDELWSYELGAKWHLFDNRLRIDATVYHFKWEDQQLNFTTTSGVQVIANTGDSSGTGFEYSLTWITPVEGLTLHAAGNINNTEFDDIQNPQYFVGTPNVAEGKRVASVPKRNHSLSVDYTTALGDSGMDLVFYGSHTYIDEQGDPGDPLARMGGSHDLVKLRAGVVNEKWGVYLFGDNMLDDDEAIWVTGSGVTRYYPRVIGVELSFDY